jgi:hypothetical protein
VPQEVNYNAILTNHNVLQRVARGEIDEVWTFGFPHAGFYESTMGGPGAFWCNAPTLKNTEASKRRLVVVLNGVGQVLYGLGNGQRTCRKQGVSFVGCVTAAPYPKAGFDIRGVVRSEHWR